VTIDFMMNSGRWSRSASHPADNVPLDSPASTITDAPAINAIVRFL
jgi:hypothetical protein